GIEEATEEAAKRRCPFLINVLDACGFISQNVSTITVEKLIIAGPIVRANPGEKIEDAQHRAERLWNAIKNATVLPTDDVSILREIFGKEFLTDSYHLKEYEYIEEL